MLACDKYSCEGYKQSMSMNMLTYKMGSRKDHCVKVLCNVRRSGYLQDTI